MSRFERIKPASSVRTRLGLAALAWTVVGAGLLGAGTFWLYRAWGGPRLLLLLPAVLLGWLKARFVLEPRARDNARRIVEAGEGRCVGSFFTFGAWAFVGGMMLLGLALRRSAMPRAWIGLVYAAVGTALVLGSRAAWGAWWRDGGPSPGPPGPQA